MYSYNTNSVNWFNERTSPIGDQQVYGTFENDRHYLLTLDLLLASTRETENRHQFFLQNIFPYVNSNSMIDIGIGDGELTALAAKYFQEITMVDPSVYGLEIAAHRIATDKKLYKMATSIVDATLPTNHYDLAILSHTLYYLPRDLWLETTKKVLSSLKENGLLVIVLNGGLDKDRVADLFGGKRLEIAEFITECREQSVARSINLSLSREHFQAEDLSTMLSIAGLHLYDVGATATHQQLASFLIKNKNRQTCLYQFMVYQQFILIRNQASNSKP